MRVVILSKLIHSQKELCLSSPANSLTLEKDELKRQLRQREREIAGEKTLSVFIYIFTIVLVVVKT